MHNNRVAILLAVMFTYGCTTITPTQYTASSTVRGPKAIRIGSVSYAPAQEGNVPPDQFQKVEGSWPNPGTWKLERDIADYCKRAWLAELEYGQMFRFDAHTELSAIVTAFSFSRVGVNTFHWVFKVTFSLSGVKSVTRQIVIERDSNLLAGKPLNAFLSNVMRDSYERFFSDAEVSGFLIEHAGPSSQR